MKECSRCDATKPLAAFTKQARGKLGVTSVCNQCRAAINRERRAALAQTETGRATLRKWQSGRPHYKYTKASRAKHRAKLLATLAVQNAARSGKLVRPINCSECGKHCRPEAHHCDYSKPLAVVWLCRKCHTLRHKPNAIAFIETTT
jgi:hypothetical protein